MKKLLLITLSFIGSAYSMQEKNYWTPEEKELLQNLVVNYSGPEYGKWIQIAEQIPGKNASQCRIKWSNSVNPNINHSNWTPAEDQLLAVIVSNYNGPEHGKWAKISEQIPGRSRKQCEERWSRSIDPDINHAEWTEAEDEILQNLVVNYDGPEYGKWIQIAEQIPGRTAGQCLRRWSKSLSPDIKKGVWTAEEDQQLKNLVVNYNGPEYGKWAKISEQIPDRTEIQCRNRWAGSLDPKVVKRKWVPEEDVILMCHVSQYGTNNWSLVSEQIPGRTPKQCRERYTNYLTCENYSEWTREDDELLLEKYKELGPKWSKMKEFFDKRTDKQLLNRYRTLMKRKNKMKHNTTEENTKNEIVEPILIMDIKNLLNNK